MSGSELPLFSKAERRAVVVLLFLIFAAAIVPVCWPKPKPLAIVYQPFQDSFYESKAASIPALNQTGLVTPINSLFDPNAIDEAGLLARGVPSGLAKRWVKYLAKGGRFKQKVDVKKLYGMDDQLLGQLLPMMVMKDAEQPFLQNKSNAANASKQQRKFTLDINVADSSSWLKLPGIGPGYTARILRFKRALGGFYAVEQVRETFGLPDSVFQRIQPMLICQQQRPIRVININTATEVELKMHPYIRWQMAKLIVNYRQQHGTFTAIDDLLLIHPISTDWLNKVKPYLSLY